MNQATVRTTNPLLKRYQQLFLSGRDGNVFEGSLTGSGGFVRDVHKKVSITRASATAVSSRTTKRTPLVHFCQACPAVALERDLARVAPSRWFR